MMLVFTSKSLYKIKMIQNESYWIGYLNYVYVIYHIFVPIVIFLKTKNSNIRSHNVCLAICILIFPVIVFTLNLLRQLGEMTDSDDKCWIYDFYFLLLFIVIPTVYVGWWELIRRAFHKQLFMSIRQNINYGLFSSLIIFISVVVTIYFIISVAGCFSCLAGPYLVIAWVYENIVPLVC